MCPKMCSFGWTTFVTMLRRSSQPTRKNMNAILHNQITETENLEDVAKNSFQSLCSSPQAMFFLIKKNESLSHSATFTFCHLLSPPSHCRGLQPQEEGRGWLTLGHPQESSPTFAKKHMDILKLWLLNKWVCVKVILTCFWAGPPFEERRQTEKNQAARGTHRSWGPSPKKYFQQIFLGRFCSYLIFYWRLLKCSYLNGLIF